MRKIDKPATNLMYYNPLEKPKRYPLELRECSSVGYFKDNTASFEICLWDNTGEYKWTIAYWLSTNEGFDLKFVGNRPLDRRVNWEHFRELIVQGQKLADKKFKKIQKSL